MDMSSGDLNIMEWDENDVQSWFAHLGFPQYETQIKGWLRVLVGFQRSASYQGIFYQNTT
jgi:hypothetical protein